MEIISSFRHLAVDNVSKPPFTENDFKTFNDYTEKDMPGYDICFR